MTDLVPIRRALISLSDKTGLDELAAGLARHGVELVSTGGTAAKLRELGDEVRDITDLTGFPEMMDGRVKTLHPKVHGGLLGVRDNPEHAAAMDEHGIAPIDLVVVNLYPFLSDRDERRRPRRDHREYRHRRPVDGPLGGQEPRPCRDRHRPGRLCRAARRARRATAARPLDFRKRLAAKAYRADRRL